MAYKFDGQGVGDGPDFCGPGYRFYYGQGSDHGTPNGNGYGDGDGYGNSRGDGFGDGVGFGDGEGNDYGYENPEDHFPIDLIVNELDPNHV
jgi:hypothetical protein